ncbi:MAG: hypothetical protein R6V35_02470, partial [Candidatus Nanohaloarchaea archaeon]
ELKEKYDEFYIVIGSSEESRTDNNPLTFEERKNLIHACHPELEILGLEDTEKTSEGNIEWAEKLEKLGLDRIISGNDLVIEIIDEHTDIEHEWPEMHDEEIYSGTEVRRRINSGEEWRYLVPKCSYEEIEDLIEKIKASGTQYNFEPGWKQENAFHGTSG